MKGRNEEFYFGTLQFPIIWLCLVNCYTVVFHQHFQSMLLSGTQNSINTFRDIFAVHQKGSRLRLRMRA